MHKFINIKYISLFSLLYVTALLIGLFITTPTQACACGMLIPQGGRDIAMKGEEGLVIFDGLKNKEQMVINFQLDGTSNNSALVVPTPVKPDISQVKSIVFTDLHNIAFPQSENNSDRMGMMGAAPGSNSVEVLERKTVGNFEIAVLKTNSYTDLYYWTKENGFNLQAEAESPIRTYIDNKFILNVIKLKKNADISDINPLKFTFDTKTLFYPLMEVKDERDSLKDKSLDLYLLTDGMITPSVLLNNSTVINKEVSKSTLEQDITKTDENDFSNLDFTANKYYLTFYSTYDYSANALLVNSLGNPGPIAYTPIGLDYSYTNITDTLVWIFPVVFGFIFAIAVVLFFVWRNKKTVKNNNSTNKTELIVIPGATVRDNPIKPNNSTDKTDKKIIN